MPSKELQRHYQVSRYLLHAEGVISLRFTQLHFFSHKISQQDKKQKEEISSRSNTQFMSSLAVLTKESLLIFRKVQQVELCVTGAPVCCFWLSAGTERNVLRVFCRKTIHSALLLGHKSEYQLSGWRKLDQPCS